MATGGLLMEEESNADVALSTVQVADMEEREQRNLLCALDLCGTAHLSSHRTCITTILLSRQKQRHVLLWTAI